MVPGYKVCVPECADNDCNVSNAQNRRSLVIWLLFNRIASCGFRLRDVYSSIVDLRTRGRTLVFLIPDQNIYTFSSVLHVVCSIYSGLGFSVVFGSRRISE